MLSDITITVLVLLVLLAYKWTAELELFWRPHDKVIAHFIIMLIVSRVFSSQCNECDDNWVQNHKPAEWALSLRTLLPLRGCHCQCRWLWIYFMQIISQWLNRSDALWETPHHLTLTVRPMFEVELCTSGVTLLSENVTAHEKTRTQFAILHNARMKVKTLFYFLVN